MPPHCFKDVCCKVSTRGLLFFFSIVDQQWNQLQYSLSDILYYIKYFKIYKNMQNSLNI